MDGKNYELYLMVLSWKMRQNKIPARIASHLL